MFRVIILILCVLFGAQNAAAQAFSCTVEKYCGNMRNCAEAVFHLRQCGYFARDGDKDGIPCERLCGKTTATMNRRLKAQGYRPGAVRLFADPAGQKFSCDRRKTCRQMVSCDEAKFHLNTCGNRRLDGNSDGIPCNSLCR